MSSETVVCLLIHQKALRSGKQAEGNPFPKNIFKNQISKHEKG